MDALLEVKDLKKYFPVYKGLVKRTIGQIKAIDGVSFSIARGETFGLVGESGCGKTTVGKTILRLYDPTAGQIILDGLDIGSMKQRELRKNRDRMQMVFQDPYGSLNPRMTIETIIGEPIKERRLASGAELSERVQDLMNSVGLNTKELKKYPHEFSGGQRQRIAIARAIAVNPKLVVCDEPVSALDVSVQAQILNLLRNLQQKCGVTYLFIAHGMPAVKFMSRRIGVMYFGRLVEIADAKELFQEQLHPYSKMLISAVPIADPTQKSQHIIPQGEVPNQMKPPSGCPFHPRCPFAMERCRQEMPLLKEVSPSRLVACHLVNQ